MDASPPLGEIVSDYLTAQAVSLKIAQVCAKRDVMTRPVCAPEKDAIDYLAKRAWPEAHLVERLSCGEHASTFISQRMSCH